MIREYDIASSLLDKWIKQSQTTGSFKEKENCFDELEADQLTLNEYIDPFTGGPVQKSKK